MLDDLGYTKTLDFMEKEVLTADEIIDFVEEFAEKQGRCSAINSSCKYRLAMPDGSVLKCFVGAMIRDYEYRDDMEDNTVQTLKATDMLPSRLIPHVNLLSELQAIHDRTPVHKWKEALQELRYFYNS